MIGVMIITCAMIIAVGVNKSPKTPNGPARDGVLGIRTAIGLVHDRAIVVEPEHVTSAQVADANRSGRRLFAGVAGQVAAVDVPQAGGGPDQRNTENAHPLGARQGRVADGRVGVLPEVTTHPADPFSLDDVIAVDVELDILDGSAVAAEDDLGPRRLATHHTGHLARLVPVGGDERDPDHVVAAPPEFVAQRDQQRAVGRRIRNPQVVDRLDQPTAVQSPSAQPVQPTLHSASPS